MVRTLSDGSIGNRLRRLRNERGLTQEQFAERAGVSVDLIKKLEQGRRESARLTTVAALATALDVPRSALLDKRPRLDDDRALALGLRDALLSVDVLHGLDPQHDAEPADVDTLWRHIDDGWRRYWAGRFGDLAQTVPGIVGEARHAYTASGAPAAGPLAQAYQLAACLLVHLGREDLAAVGAERAIAAAATGDDELQWATLHGTFCWALLAQARHRTAEGLAARVAERIEPKFSTASPEHLTVWGGLVLWAMAAAVEDGRADAAADHLSLARVGIARMNHDRHDYQVNYGPTQVAMQTTYAHAVLGQPDRALAAAAGVRRHDLRDISWARHLLDTAQAHLGARQYDRAAAKLKEARDQAPVWFRHQSLARMLVMELAERRTRLTGTLRELVHSLEVHR
jgi:transcriptional regulator with XRE-family HTH domain